MLRGSRRKWHQPTPLFVELHLCEHCLQGTLLRRVNNLTTVAPDIFQITVSRLSAPGLFSSLLSRSNAVVSVLYLSHVCRPLKLQVLSSSGCKNSWNTAPLPFQVSGLGENFFSVLLHFSAGEMTSPTLVPTVIFSFKLLLHTFYLLWWGLSSPFISAFYTVRLEIDIWGIWDDLMDI